VASASVVEPDAAAVSIATTRGADIIGSHLDELEGKFDGYFDVITLSHVIEHVHNPVDFCQGCWRMLKRGGFLWIETPNIDSIGYEIYSDHGAALNRQDIWCCLPQNH